MTLRTLASRTRERIENLATHVRTELVARLVLEHGVRLSPAMLEWFTELLRRALDAARLIGQLHAARPEYPPKNASDDVDDLADTKPMRTKPPPPPKKVV